MNRTEFFDLCKTSFSQNGVSVYATDQTLEKLFSLCEIFLETNKSLNLSAIRDEKQTISHHFADCLIPASFFPAGSTVLDVGSGGGMPALPLAAARPDLKITALDATAKKTAFIVKAARGLGLENVSVVTGRAEELAFTDMRETFDCVTARAVAQTNVLCELCAPFVKVGGLFVAMKGKKGGEELAAAGGALKKLSLETVACDAGTLVALDGEISERYALVFKKTAQTPTVYPRKYAQIVKKPL